MNEQEFLFNRDGAVGVMTLNRPAKLNALSPGITAGLLRVMREMEDDDETRALVLQGNGRAFCAGGDVAGFPTGEANRERREASVANRRPARETSVTLALRNCRKIVVGALHGYAVGGGLSIALACDIRIAAEGTRFAPVQVRRGILPDMGLTHLLPRVVGTQKALELAVRAGDGGFFDAQEALDLGIVTKVVPPEALLDEAMEIARMIARGPTLALGFAKEGIYRGVLTDLEAALEFEGPKITACFASDDCDESRRAFVEKRQPVFVGH
jgi:2-(1,2-epoxy-1,2-dihydrophenyl)acetyl-CoA isomerase